MAASKKDFHPGEVPAKPGVYVFRDRFGKVIYVGKAASLRKRMSQYFQPSRLRRADPKQRSLIKSIFDWEYYTVKNEDESLILESRLIKQYAPHYNVLMRDDKRYLLVKINLNEKYPRLILARVRKDDGCKYFGPFPKGSALKNTVDFLASYFGLRTCKCTEPDLETRRHCLKRIIKECCEPCIGKVTRKEYHERVKKMLDLLNGNVSKLLEELDGKMREAANNLQFEKAGRLRDVVTNINEVFGSKTRSFRFAAIPSAPGEEAVKDLQEVLKLPNSPTTIEGFDNSNIMGTMAVSSMVCFENGRPARDKYRRFRVRSVNQIDDFATMKEVLQRHYGKKLREQRPLPDLIMVDGGKGQLSAAIDILVDIGCPPLPVIGLAKKREEIFIPGRSEPVVLDRHSPALRLLQALRDEAHRFAISYHRQLRDKRLQESLLDDIPGVGEKRKAQLLRSFGSVRRLRKATAEQIMAKVPGTGKVFAERIVEFLKKKD
ncbi:excinuclease ABC subunit UvrC [Lentisphaerota bacterium ZTH]|nr:excinuclease ABC subunit UvrC [Lentisphaerota bacterium]WET06348.1 excinuclease ABC subunit UvrC [Lentisphaerota bacterium ZTH]